VAWFPVGKALWEPYLVMAVDVPDMVAKFMESHECYAKHAHVFRT
jgi:hypothetical protein